MQAGLVSVEPGFGARLYEPWNDQLATQAVLAGVAPGTVWVDEPAAPALALMKVGHRLYLAGDCQAKGPALAQLGCTLFEQVLPAAKARGEDGYLLYYHDAGWEAVLGSTLFAGRKVYPGRRNYYELSDLTEDWQPPVTPDLPAGLNLRAVDAALLEQSHLRNHAALLEEMQSERESVADFMAKSFGSLLVSADAIITWCLSEYNLGDRCEIGIATDEGYRRQGLATLTAIGMIRQSAAQKMRRVGWHCWLLNEGSNATARKLGFKHINEHGAFYIPA